MCSFSPLVTSYMFGKTVKHLANRIGLLAAKTLTAAKMEMRAPNIKIN